MITDRQRREIEYHAAFAMEHGAKASEPVDMSILGNRRRWWNAYWTAYTRLLELDLSGKRILVPGCGFGGDAIRLTYLGAEVYGFDISLEMIGIAKERAERFASGPIRLAVMPVETMAYPADFFDAVLFVDILHHVDIAKAVSEISRVLKPDGMVIGDAQCVEVEVQTQRLAMGL
jgi:SAM-dependent methyltransferase